MDKIQIDKFVTSMLNPSENTRSKIEKRCKTIRRDDVHFVNAHIILDLIRGALDDQGLEFDGSEIINK